MRIKLTERAVERIKAPTGNGKQALHWDAELKGFGVLCSGCRGQRPTSCSATSPAAPAGLPSHRPTCSHSARRAGAPRRCWRTSISAAIPKRAGAAASTCAARSPTTWPRARICGRKSVEEYRASIERHLAAWLNRPLREITPEMVEARHRAIAAEVLAGGRYSGEASANGAMRALRVLWNFAMEREPNLPANPVRATTAAVVPGQQA